MQLRAYQGSPDAPFPPSASYFTEVPASDRFARDCAAGLIGELPPYHYLDHRGPEGIYRFFAYETPLGVSVSALRRPLEDDPSLYEGGTLGQTNPNFTAPSAAQVAAVPPGDTLASAAVALLTDFSANGVPSEHDFNQSVDTFQTAWNADPLSQQNANGQLSEDGDYGQNTHDALASISGGTAPAVNTSPGTTPTPTPTPTGGQTTHEPVPQPDASCAGWAADASTAQATAIAQNISFHDSPTPWTDQGIYNTTISGVPYRFVMWWENGLKAVAAYRCTSGGAPPATAQASTSSAPAIILGTLFVGGLVTAGLAAKKPISRAMRHHR